MGYAHDIGSQVVAQSGFVLYSSSTGITTGSTGSMGFHVDRLGMAGSFQSVKSIVECFVRQVSTSALGYYTVTLGLEDAASSNSTSFSTFTTATSLVVGSITSAAAANYEDNIAQDINLAGADRWIRQIVTVARAATSSFDCVQVGGTLVFGGADILPATT